MTVEIFCLIVKNLLFHYHLGHNRLHWSWPEARHRPWSISTYSEWLLGEIQQARPPKLAGGKWLPKMSKLSINSAKASFFEKKLFFAVRVLKASLLMHQSSDPE